jgi:23S rRNA (uridine2552-2'-O)-methyltransferase
MARSKTSKAWMQEHVSDPYVRRARAEGYRSRAAYKLLELNRRDHLLRPGLTVVDLGSAPGGWSQVVAERVGAAGRVLAVDRLEMAPIQGVAFILGDFRDQATLERLAGALGGRRADLVLSDMAPNISGVAEVDRARSLELAQAVVEFCQGYLKPGGTLLVKVFQGAGFEEFATGLRRRFLKVAVRKPGASRSRSPEVYLLASGFRGPARATEEGDSV